MYCYVIKKYPLFQDHLNSIPAHPNNTIFSLHLITWNIQANYLDVSLGLQVLYESWIGGI